MTISATTQGLRMGVATSSSRPTVPFDGQVISETDTDSLQVYNGSAWIAVGKVLQVVQSTYSTQTSTSSTSYVTTGQTASITPSSTSNKILVFCSFPAQSAASQNMNITLFRGTVAGTDLAPGANGFGYWSGGTVNLVGTFSMIYLDSPNTTSATTYTAGMKTTGGTVYSQVGSTIGTMTLMEISA